MKIHRYCILHDHYVYHLLIYFQSSHPVSNVTTGHGASPDASFHNSYGQGSYGNFSHYRQYGQTDASGQPYSVPSVLNTG